MAKRKTILTLLAQKWWRLFEMGVYLIFEFFRSKVTSSLEGKKKKEKVQEKCERNAAKY